MIVEQKMDDEGDVVTVYTITREDILEERVQTLEREVAVLYANLEDLAYWIRYGNCA